MTTAANHDLADKINAILSLQYGSLIRHIGEAKPHLSARTWKAWHALDNLQDHRQMRIHLLVRILVEDMDKQPAPTDFDQTVGFAHFLTLDALMPKFVKELEETRKHLQSLLPTKKSAMDDKIQSVIELCDKDIQAVGVAMKLASQTPSTLG
ncbi:MAG: hypothetical protein CMJ19_14535 [Phycisphaeraceae bacterium]|nr:hypothetical protein [Phycisphaeraceae bacterium]